MPWPVAAPRPMPSRRAQTRRARCVRRHERPARKPRGRGRSIAEIVRSGARFVSTLSALPDADMCAPSALPAWPRGHVVSHVARGMDAYVWLLTVARTGAHSSPDHVLSRLAQRAPARGLPRRRPSRSRAARAVAAAPGSRQGPGLRQRRLTRPYRSPVAAVAPSPPASLRSAGAHPTGGGSVHPPGEASRRRLPATRQKG
ncbi:maleylpyruvate isomerase N-terminal domain-containing protein [Streptomyces sp. NPDC051211]|uniref:maleylpyruvate isomerase N-terminal domain-containing protein n=1 Tax=Streptomyces sp. NPDC051211 TaxID=3154643 RepID=UPI00344E9853